MNINSNIDLITILGPTATGKTNLAVRIAEHISSEIISADSRQIYKGMDIGTGKDLSEYNINNKIIRYHLIDIINPNQDYSVYTFQKEFHKIYNKIIENKKQAILCGGTGLYIESVLLNYKMSNIKPNYDLRNSLDIMSKEELLELFKNIDFQMSNDWKCDTKQRIIRGIEIASGKSQNIKYKNHKLDLSRVIVLGIKMERDKIRERITKRLSYRLENGMIEEVEKLLQNKKLSLDRLDYFGLEYKFIGNYLNNKISYNELFNKLNTAIHKFAKKQMTFFRRMEKRGVEINWLKDGSFDEAINIINLK